MELYQIEEDVAAESSRVTTLGEYFAWAQRCDECIEKLEEQCRAKRPRLSLGRNHSLVARIAQLEGLKKELETRFIHVGGGDHAEQPSNTKLSWREIDTAFNNRVLTGAVINADYIDPRRFLEDVRDVVLEHVRNAIDRHSSVKVNTMFNGEFVAGEKTANKSINTRNRELFKTSDLQEHNPMHAGCRIKLPEEIKTKKAVVNVQSKDNACFAWSVIATLYPAEEHVDRPSSYPHYTTVLNLKGIEFPATLKQIKKFELLNDISVNVYAAQEKKKEEEKLTIVPIRLADEKKCKHVNLLYMQDPQDNVGHFAYIKNLSWLVSSQLSSNKRKKYICDRCLHYFHTNEKLEAHTVDCQRMNDCAIVLPNEEDKWLSFTNYNRKERIPFVVYANLECILQKTEEDDDPKLYQRHQVFSIGYYMRCNYDASLSGYRSRRDTDCIAWFIEQLKHLAHRVKAILSRNVPMKNLTRGECEKYNSATHCHICEKPFCVRRHAIFHNLSGYDSHVIIKEIATAFEGAIDVLPINKEKYISFTKHVNESDDKKWRNHVQLRFIDLYKFLSSSLDKLSSYLNKDKLRIVRSVFVHLSTNDFDLLTRKGVFPYEYVDCAEKLEDTRLPPRESFYSSLTGNTVSESDYAHAVNVWQRFAIRTLGEYSDLYLKTDVLLLADVFENFRDSCIKSYGLDPAYYYTLPGFTWDAMLKHTRINFELLTDIDMIMFIERGIRGGLSQCSHRYAQANNKYMQSYDPSKPSSYLMYFDVNNLYGWAMCQPLPYANFRWVDDTSNFNMIVVTPDSPKGYVLEVDLEYPRHLHDAHADLPFCPTRDKPPGKWQDKLLTILCDKKRYVIHYRNLQQCTRHGLRVTKIHRVLEYAQSPWLREYIELNTRFRAAAKNDFEKNLYKLMNNAVFGKTMENVRNHVDVKLLTKWNGRYGAEAMIAKPNFHSRSVFSENLVAIEMRKLEVKFNKPIYVVFERPHRNDSRSIPYTVKLHNVLYTVHETKIALSPHDDKRYIVPKSTNTLPWGHYRVPL
ncbi:uncharacterized protein LOC113563293 [Ooceraea biroi]|uniref:uncharacterized protein LOC113563293 n=1 Tax=Ooceraea biroi TaxID=2015173 RepID=UPI000F089772|nr:uncharacterized protein LOC113563293 [Ooceraea biroi]